MRKGMANDNLRGFHVRNLSPIGSVRSLLPPLSSSTPFRTGDRTGHRRQLVRRRSRSLSRSPPFHPRDSFQVEQLSYRNEMKTFVQGTERRNSILHRSHSVVTTARSPSINTRIPARTRYHSSADVSMIPVPIGHSKTGESLTRTRSQSVSNESKAFSNNYRPPTRNIRTERANPGLPLRNNYHTSIVHRSSSLETRRTLSKRTQYPTSVAYSGEPLANRMTLSSSSMTDLRAGGSRAERSEFACGPSWKGSNGRSSTKLHSVVRTPRSISSVVSRSTRRSTGAAQSFRGRATARRGMPPTKRPTTSALQSQPRGTLNARSNLSRDQMRMKDEEDSLRNELMRMQAQSQRELREEQREVNNWEDQLIVLRREVSDGNWEAERTERHEQELRQSLVISQRELLLTNDQLALEHERIFKLKGHARLYLRVRPVLEDEKSPRSGQFALANANTLQIEHRGVVCRCRSERIFLEWHTQIDVMQEASEFIMNAMEGHHVSIVACGQKGSGKTFTMRGGEAQEAGIIPRSIQLLFQSVSDLSVAGWQVEARLSVFEIQAGECFDLLGEEGRRRCQLHMSDDRINKNELTALDISSAQQAMELVDNSRAFSPQVTAGDENEEMGHVVVRIDLNINHPHQVRTKTSSISLVELAGSPSTGGLKEKSHDEPQRNAMSLDQLAIVMQAQRTGSDDVSYADDPLTVALSDSLGCGTSKTMFITTIRPDLRSIPESMRLIEFAKQAIDTQNGRTCSRKNTKG